MLKHLIHFSIRSLQRNKWLQLTNILGLSIGMASFAIIFYFFQFEHSFDNFHPNKDRLYRVVMTRFINGEQVSKRANTYPALMPVLNEQFPEISNAELAMPGGVGILMDFGTEGNSKLRDDVKTLSVDRGFFDLFDVALIEGSIERLDEPFVGLISSEIAESFYKGRDPIGSTWTEDDGTSYTIIGVFEPWRQNSHLDFEVIKSFESIGARHGVDFHRTSWDWDRMKLYVKLNERFDLTEVEDKVSEAIVNNKPEKTAIDLQEYVSLQPVSDIHLYSDFEGQTFLSQKANKINGLLLIGIIILVIAWVNFINFTLSLAVSKIKRVGVQKTLGARISYFIKQQVTESVIVNLLALGISLSLWQVFVPQINTLADIPDQFHAPSSFYLTVLLVTMAGVVLTILVPILMVRRVKITLALKGKLNTIKLGSDFFRSGLVVFQWVASLILILAVFVIQDQLNYLESIDPGVKTEGVLVVKGPRSFDYDWFSNNPDRIKKELQNIAGVEMVGSSYAVPGDTPSAYEIREEGKPLANNVFIPEHQVDANYIHVYEHKILAGRNFDPTRKSDETAAILNQSAAAALFGDLNYNALLGKRITSPEDEYIRTVIGIVEDYYHLSPEVAHFPMNFVFDPESRGFYSIQFRSVKLADIEREIQAVFDQVFPGNIYHSFLLDDFYADYQTAEKQLSSLLLAFGITAILLSLVGVVALTLLDLSRKMKELSIRKVLGAELLYLYYNIGFGNFKRFLWAVIIAIPVSYYLMQNWLGSYANRIGLGIVHMLPALAMLLVLGIVLFAGTRRSLKQNPTQYLKSE